MSDPNNYGRDQRGPYSTPEGRPYHQGGEIPRIVGKPPKHRRVSRVVLAVVGLCTLAIIGVVSCTALMFDGAIGATGGDVRPVISEPGPRVPAPSAKPVEKAPTSNLPRDGVLIVGKDLKPGLYQATCPEESVVGCYWARLKDTDGELESVLANNVTSVGGRITLRVKATDYAIEIRGGAAWKRVG